MYDHAYENDHRVRAAARGTIFNTIDEDALTATLTVYDENDEEDEITIRLCYEVCDTCGGKGRHVNPSIDAGGLTSEDFAEDPDFAEAYFAGHYDVPCYGCKGRRVALGVDRTATSKENLALYDERVRDEAAYAAEVAAERRMGA